jgi:hypothetical protein
MPALNIPLEIATEIFTQSIYRQFNATRFGSDFGVSVPSNACCISPWSFACARRGRTRRPALGGNGKACEQIALVSSLRF